MKVSTSFSSAKVFLEAIAGETNVEIQEDCQRTKLDLPGEYGEGQFICYSVNEGLEALIVDATFTDDWVVDFPDISKPPIVFYTLAEGNFNHVHRDRNDEIIAEFLMKPLQSVISSQGGAGVTKWMFPKNEKHLFLIIFIHKEPFFTDINCETLEIPTDLLEILYDIKGQKKFLFKNIYFLPIITSLQDILTQEDVGLLNSTFATAKVYEILFFQLQQYHANSQKNNAGFITADQGLDLIRNAENILVARLQDPPTILELSKMAGLNQQSLKKGFKQLYGQTIKQYLNEKRLEQAEFLIRNSQLKLQDVAMEVGYSNPSHFSRRFKEKYGMAPKYYARQVS